LGVIAYNLGNRGEPLATISVAEEDWELVADKPAAALRKDRRTAGTL